MKLFKKPIVFVLTVILVITSLASVIVAGAASIDYEGTGVEFYGLNDQKLTTNTNYASVDTTEANKATVKFDETSGAYEFIGWFVDDTCVGTDKTLTLTEENKSAVAKILSKNALTNGGSFENVDAGEITKIFNTNTNKIDGVKDSECNSPADLKTNELYDNWTTSNSTVPDWGYHVYSAASDITSDNITITPHSGDKMIKIGKLGGRYAIYYLNGLKPNQKYTLKFYTHAGSESSYLNNALVSTSHLGSYIKKMNGSSVIAEGTLGTDLGSCSVKDTIYSYEWKDNSHCITGLKGQTNDANAWNSWVPVTIDFETDSTGDAYLHLQHSAKQVESRWVYYCYIDDLTVVPQEETEDVAVKVVNTKGEDVTNKTYSVKAQKIIDIYGNTKLKALNTSDEYKFLGWYDKGTDNLNSTYGTNEEYDLGNNRTVDVSKLEARFKTTNVLTNGGSFENVDAGNLYVGKDSGEKDQWNTKYYYPVDLNDTPNTPNNWTAGYSNAYDYQGKISAVKTQDYAGDNNNISTTVIKPHSGDTMIKVGRLGTRTYIYSLKGLNPNQNYTLKFYTCAGHKSTYLQGVYVTNSYKDAEYVTNPKPATPATTLAMVLDLDDSSSGANQVYKVGWKDNKKCITSLVGQAASDTAWSAWAPVTINFKTDSTGVAYLHLFQNSNGENGYFYIDDLTVVPQATTDNVTVEMINAKGESVTFIDNVAISAQKVVDLDGTAKLVLNKDTTDDYSFEGWFNDGTKVDAYGTQTEVVVDRALDISKLTARIKTTNDLTNGGSFENVLAGNITKVSRTDKNNAVDSPNGDAAVNSPADLQDMPNNWTTSNNIIPDWRQNIESVKDDSTASDGTTIIKPHSGDTMIKIGKLGGRYAIYRLQGLEANQGYTLKLYTHAGSKNSFLGKALVTTSHIAGYVTSGATSTGKDLGSTSAEDFYTIGWESGKKCISGLKGGANDENAWNNWVLVSLKFKTDETGKAYLHLQQTAADNSQSFYIDDISCIADPETTVDIKIEVQDENGNVSKDADTSYFKASKTTYIDKTDAVISADFDRETLVGDENNSTMFEFKGWYNGNTRVTKELSFNKEKNYDVSDLKAVFVSRNILTNGGSFENLTSNGTIAVAKNSETGAVGSPFDAKQVDGKWVLYNLPTSLEGKPDNWTFKYLDKAVADWKVAIKSVYDPQKTGTVKPRSGDSMVQIVHLGGRTAIYKLNGLKPGTDYKLTYYLYTDTPASSISYSTIADNFDNVQGKYGLPAENSDTNILGVHSVQMKEANKWTKQEIAFTTGATDTAYLHLYIANGGGSTYVDDMYCVEGKFYVPEPEISYWGMYGTTVNRLGEKYIHETDGWAFIRECEDPQYDTNGDGISLHIRTNARPVGRKLENLEYGNNYKISFDYYLPETSIVKKNLADGATLKLVGNNPGIYIDGAEVSTYRIADSDKISGHRVGNVEGLRGETGWHTYEAVFKCPYDTNVHFAVTLGFDSGYNLYLDNFKVEKTTAAPTYLDYGHMAMIPPGIDRYTDLSYCESNVNMVTKAGGNVAAGKPGIYEFTVEASQLYTLGVTAKDTNSNAKIYMAFDKEGKNPVTSVDRPNLSPVIKPNGTETRYGYTFLTDKDTKIYLVIEDDGGLTTKDLTLFRTNTIAKVQNRGYAEKVPTELEALTTIELKVE